MTKPTADAEPVILNPKDQTVWELTEIGPFQAYMPAVHSDLPPKREPTAWLNLPSLLPWEVYQQMKAFLLWTHREHRQEGLITAFFSDEGDWIPFVPKQECAHSMTVKWVESEENDKLLEQLSNAGFRTDICNTFHHHCGGSAGQSGPDHDDEQSKTGIHITFGKMGDKMMDIHGRYSVIRKGEQIMEGPDAGTIVVPAHTQFFTMSKPAFRSLFEIPVEIDEKLPEQLQNQIFMHYILGTEEVGEFPDAWKEQVVKRTTHTNNGNTGGYGQPHNRNNQTGWQGKKRLEDGVATQTSASQDQATRRVAEGSAFDLASNADKKDEFELALFTLLVDKGASFLDVVLTYLEMGDPSSAVKTEAYYSDLGYMGRLLNHLALNQSHHDLWTDLDELLDSFKLRWTDLIMYLHKDLSIEDMPRIVDEAMENCEEIADREAQEALEIGFSIEDIQRHQDQNDNDFWNQSMEEWEKRLAGHRERDEQLKLEAMRESIENQQAEKKEDPKK